MITPLTSDTIVYQYELDYTKGRSLRNFKERRLRKIWAHIQRWFTMWSIIAAISLPLLVSTPLYV